MNEIISVHAQMFFRLVWSVIGGLIVFVAFQFPILLNTKSNIDESLNKIASKYFIFSIVAGILIAIIIFKG